MKRIKVTDLEYPDIVAIKIAMSGIIQALDESVEGMPPVALAFIVQEINNVIQKVTEHEAKSVEEMIQSTLNSLGMLKGGGGEVS